MLPVYDTGKLCCGFFFPLQPDMVVTDSTDLACENRGDCFSFLARVLGSAIDGYLYTWGLMGHVWGSGWVRDIEVRWREETLDC